MASNIEFRTSRQSFMLMSDAIPMLANTFSNDWTRYWIVTFDLNGEKLHCYSEVNYYDKDKKYSLHVSMCSTIAQARHYINESHDFYLSRDYSESYLKYLP